MNYLESRQKAHEKYMEIVRTIAPDAVETVLGVLFEMVFKGDRTIYMLYETHRQGGILKITTYIRGLRLSTSIIYLEMEGCVEVARKHLEMMTAYIKEMDMK